MIKKVSLSLFFMFLSSLVVAETNYFSVSDSQTFSNNVIKFAFGNSVYDGTLDGFLDEPKQVMAKINTVFFNKYYLNPLLVTQMLNGRIECYTNKKGFALSISYASAAKASDILDKITQSMGVIMNTPPMFVGTSQNRTLKTGSAGEIIFILSGKRLMMAVTDTAEHSKILLKSFNSQTNYQMSPAQFVFYNNPTESLSDNRYLRAYAQIIKDFGLPGVSAPTLLELNFKQQAIDATMTNYKTQALLEILKKQSVSTDLLNWLPKDIDTGIALNIKWDSLICVLQSYLSKTGDANLAIQLNLVETFCKMACGVDLDSKLLKGLESGLVFGMFSQGSGGGFPLISTMGVNSSFMVLKMRNPKQVSQQFKKLFSFLAKQASGDSMGGGLKSIEIEGYKTYYIKYYAGVFAPSITVVDNYLILTNNLTVLKKLLQGKSVKYNVLSKDLDFMRTCKLTGQTDLATGFWYQRYKPISMGFIGGLGGVAMSSFLIKSVLPHFESANKADKKTDTLMSLQLLGRVLVSYRQNHQGNLPNTLAQLLYEEQINPDIFKELIKRIVYLKVEDKKNKQPQMYTALPSGDLATLYTDGSLRVHSPLSDGFKVAKQAQVLSRGLAGIEQFGSLKQSKGQIFVKLVKKSTQKLLSSFDFALFPALSDFESHHSSNLLLLNAKKQNIVSRIHIGHILTSANQLTYMFLLHFLKLGNINGKKNYEY